MKPAKHKSNAGTTPAPPTRVHRFSVIGAGRPGDMNRLQKSFYARHFKPRFLTADPIDVDGQEGYGIVMLHELLAQFDADPVAAISGLQLLERAYPRSSPAWSARDCLRDIYLLIGRWEEALSLSSSSQALGMILGLPDELGHPRVDPVNVFVWNGGRVTAYRELDGVIAKLGQDLDAFHDEHRISMVEDFWNRLTADVPVSDIVASIRDDVGFDLDDEDITWSIKRVRELGMHYEPTAFYLYEGYERPIALPRPWPRPEVFGLVWREFLKTLVRAAENHARVNAGLPRVSEGLVSEVRLLNELRTAFPNEIVHHQVRPTWLAPQSLDMVFADRKLGIEYQGAQHSRPVDFFGGQVAFETQQMRDAIKRELCAANGMRLVEVHPGYTLTDVVRQIRDMLVAPVNE